MWNVGVLSKYLPKMVGLIYRERFRHVEQIYLVLYIIENIAVFGFGQQADCMLDELLGETVQHGG